MAAREHCMRYPLGLLCAHRCDGEGTRFVCRLHDRALALAFRLRPTRIAL